MGIGGMARARTHLGVHERCVCASTSEQAGQSQSQSQRGQEGPGGRASGRASERASAREREGGRERKRGLQPRQQVMAGIRAARRASTKLTSRRSASSNVGHSSAVLGAVLGCRHARSCCTGVVCQERCEGHDALYEHGGRIMAQRGTEGTTTTCSETSCLASRIRRPAVLDPL